MYEINKLFMVSSVLVIKCVIIISKYMYVMVLWLVWGEYEVVVFKFF